jgi:hypothetical protein
VGCATGSAVALTALPVRTRTVLHYTGHRMAGAANPDGLAASAERRVADSIAGTLRYYDVVEAHGSLASGADILFAEAMLAAAAPLRLWLPFEAGRFKAVSVKPAGRGWCDRFDRIMREAASMTAVPELPDNEAAFAACAAAAMEAAWARARASGVRAVQLAVWNGHDAAALAGTAHDMAVWREMGGASCVIGV